MKKLKQQIEKLDKRLTDTENRVSATEDRSIQQEGAMSYLLQREANVTAVLDNMENRLSQ